ncbi:hypothetical protein VTO73DRAFT_9983 [Trametes versicolor]
MPVQRLVDAFLSPIPGGKKKEVLSSKGAFNDVPSSGAKSVDIYKPLLVALNKSTKLRSRAPGLVFENASINATEPHTPGFMKPHICCYTRGNLEHRSRLFIEDTRGGYLIDWETSSKFDSKGHSLDKNRTGTWKFMSAKVLRKPEQPHTFADDMESLLWVVHYCSLLYLPHNLDPDDMQSIIHELYDDSTFLRGELRGGFGKAVNRIERHLTENIEFTNSDLQKWLDDVMDLHGPKGLWGEAAERLWTAENLDTLWRGFLATHTLARDDRVENEWPEPDMYTHRESSLVTFDPPPRPPPSPRKRPVEDEAPAGRVNAAHGGKRRRVDSSGPKTAHCGDKRRVRAGPSAALPVERAKLAGAVSKPRRTAGASTRSGRRSSAGN